MRVWWCGDEISKAWRSGSLLILGRGVVIRRSVVLLIYVITQGLRVGCDSVIVVKVG